MDQEVWCFLVSANKDLDYRTVVAPDFMYEQNYTLILAKTAGGEITDKGTAYYRKIINSKVGNLTLVFRVTKALETDIGICGDSLLRDSFGRAISLIEGIVFNREVSKANIAINSEDFDKVHKQVIEYYQKFWYETRPIPAYPSKSFPFSERENKDNAFQLIKLEDYRAGKSKEETKSETNQQSTDKEKSKDKLVSDRSLSWQPQQTNERKLPREDVIKFLIDLISKIFPTPIPEFFEGLYENLFGNKAQVEVDTSNGKKIIITGEKNGNIRVEYADGEGKIEIEPTLTHDTKIICMAVDNKNKIFATGDKKGNVKIWELELGRGSLKEKTTIRASQHPIKSLAFSPDGKTLLIGEKEGKFKTWSL
ncbi:MAG: hypothetical protein F6K17_21165 [Okeania sp. SIO3C4]|nr:hypothetical protein [Okeania sp. SIO3B3]NER04929.1 hypothetical protein [Okeania sp. SIO3C4]